MLKVLIYAISIGFIKHACRSEEKKTVTLKYQKELWKLCELNEHISSTLSFRFPSLSSTSVFTSDMILDYWQPWFSLASKNQTAEDFGSRLRS
jgi:hypothetical protein